MSPTPSDTDESVPTSAEDGTDQAVTDSNITPEARVAVLEGQNRELHDRILRLAAEFENWKKRARKEQDEASARGREALLKEILPVLDNLERALKAAPEQDPVAIGVRLVDKQLLGALEKFERQALLGGRPAVRSESPRGDPAGRVRRGHAGLGRDRVRTGLHDREPPAARRHGRRRQAARVEHGRGVRWRGRTRELVSGRIGASSRHRSRDHQLVRRLPRWRRPVVIPNSEGSRTTPSIVAFAASR